MRIAFMLANIPFASPNGVTSQALTWKKGLEQRGHQISLINPWEKNDWKAFDAIILFGFSEQACGFINIVWKVNRHIIVAPILDPSYSISALKIYTRWGSRKLRLTNPFYSMRSVKEKIGLFLVRSEFEQAYMSQGFDIPIDRCAIVRLSHEITAPQSFPEREPFCLHISLLCDERKNVRRLIEAAKKHKFKLVLAGMLRNDKEKGKLLSWIGDSSNIEYVGFVSEEKKMDLYARAKVFALPSTNEGVGIVALEAAAMGCNVVMTKLGGPKEYYSDMAEIINPYDIDEIGTAVMRFMNGEISYQPRLAEYVEREYSARAIAQKLESVIHCVVEQ